MHQKSDFFLYRCALAHSVTQVIEFPHTDSYEEKTFCLSPVKGLQKISFVFLPGSDFDFSGFQFKKLDTNPEMQ